MGARKSEERKRELFIHNLIQNRNANILHSLSALHAQENITKQNNTITDPEVILVLVLCHFSKASHFQQIRYILFFSVIFCHLVYFPGLSSSMPTELVHCCYWKTAEAGDG